MAILSLGLLSCEKDEPGGTATESVAGEWYVTIDVIGKNTADTITAADMVEIGLWSTEKGIIRTFNTAANVPDKMYISDMTVFGDGQGGSGSISPYLCFQVPVNVNQATGEFATVNGDFVKNMEVNYGYDPEGGWDESEQFANVKIVNGKITKNGGKQNNGTVDDIIEFDLYINNNYLALTSTIENTLAGYGIDFECDHYHVTGIRYSGLAENN